MNGTGVEQPARGRNLTFAIVLVVALALLVAFAVAIRRSSATIEAGAVAPEFTLETFDGEAVALADLRGKVVVLNFWASWCLPCAEEAADLEQVWRDYQDRGVVVLGADYTDTRPAAEAYIERHGISYPNGMDRANNISVKYRVSGVPETVVIDQAGRLVPLGPDPKGGPPLVKVVGPIAPTAPFTPQDLRAVLDRLLAAPADG
jgi:cytochrome c biogenesis protein CcmG/thiol:disulfide interchange protein DsbE